MPWEYMKDGSTGEVLGKEICRFVLCNPSKPKMTIGEMREMLAYVSAVILCNEMDKFGLDIQMNCAQEFATSFVEFYSAILAGKTEEERRRRRK